MDIVDNVKVEKEMNTEQLETLINAQNSSIEAMATAGRITKPEANLFLDQMKKKINESFKLIDKEYQKELEKLGQKIGVKNRTEVDNLLAKQAVERTTISTETKDLPQEVYHSMSVMLNNLSIISCLGKGRNHESLE